jgi:hypothetical protein
MLDDEAAVEDTGHSEPGCVERRARNLMRVPRQKIALRDDMPFAKASGRGRLQLGVTNGRM